MREEERKKGSKIDVEAKKWIAVGGQKVRRASVTGQCREKKRDRKAGRRKEKFSLFINFFYQDEAVKSRSNPPARAEYLRSHQCSWPH